MILFKNEIFFFFFFDIFNNYSFSLQNIKRYFNKYENNSISDLYFINIFLLTIFFLYTFKLI